MSQSSSTTRPSESVGYPAAVYIPTVGTMLMCGAFFMVCWRMLQFLEISYDQQTTYQQEMRGFHKNLISELDQLVDQSAPQATEDLCQVRFRLRLDDGLTESTDQFELELSRREDDRVEVLTSMALDVATGSTANFGLVPPGEYRLSVTNSLGMESRHDFRVLPGVPVDRVILCPSQREWMFTQPLVSFQLQPEWPSVWESLPIVAVYHLESADLRIDGWEWSPPTRRLFRRWVVAGNQSGPISVADLDDALPVSMFDEPDPPLLELVAHAPISVPYDHCEISAVSFFMESTSAVNRYIHLQTIRFSSEADSSESTTLLSSDAVTLLCEESPRQVVDPKKPLKWRVKMPGQVVAQILDLVEEEVSVSLLNSQ